jgi:hypothetical protein
VPGPCEGLFDPRPLRGASHEHAGWAHAGASLSTAGPAAKYGDPAHVPARGPAYGFCVNRAGRKDRPRRSGRCSST